MDDRIIGSGNDIAVSTKRNQYSKAMKRYDNVTRPKFKCFIKRVRKKNGDVLHLKKNNNLGCQCVPGTNRRLLIYDFLILLGSFRKFL